VAAPVAEGAEEGGRPLAAVDGAAAGVMAPRPAADDLEVMEIFALFVRLLLVPCTVC
jgi:hypothetical protein